MTMSRSIRLRLLLLCLLLSAGSWACKSREVSEFTSSYSGDAPSAGALREFAIVAAPARVALFDGRAFEAWAYNSQVPGPTLRVRLGDTVRVRFTNQLPQATTIHWHGVRVPNEMDGVPGVTQAPVEPGQTFVYEFTPKDAGTFWFHPHLRASEQVERGLFGVLIVDDPTPPPYSRDELWVLDDWLLTPQGELFSAFNTRHDLAHDGRWGNVVTVNGHTVPRLAVRPGERVRLRMLNVANGRVFAPDFAGLAAQIIAVDGLYAARPIALTPFEMAPGNRLDLDIVIPPDAAGKQFTVTDRFTRQAIPLAEIVVEGDPVDTPRFASPAQAHVPAWPQAESTRPVRAQFRLDAQSGGSFGIQWTINGTAMDHAAHAIPEHRERLPVGEFSRLQFSNDSYRLHPMHIHGLFFKVLARNGVAVDEGHFRDTVLVHPKETVDVGTVPLDPGHWMLHCHILEHAESGMMTVIDVE